MRILIDTNIILDVLFKRKGLFNASQRVFKLCEAKLAEGYISAISIPNIVYIMRRELDREKTRELIGMLTTIFEIADLKKGDIQSALDLDFSDYEDALHSAQAKRVKADYIITRNVADYKKSKTIAVTPEDFLEKTGY